MPDYVVTGHVFTVPEKYQAPWNLITDQMHVGQIVTLTLSPTDEATMINAGVIIPSVPAHLYPF